MRHPNEGHLRCGLSPIRSQVIELGNRSLHMPLSAILRGKVGIDCSRAAVQVGLRLTCEIAAGHTQRRTAFHANALGTGSAGEADRCAGLPRRNVPRQRANREYFARKTLGPGRRAARGGRKLHQKPERNKPPLLRMCRYPRRLRRCSGTASRTRWWTEQPRDRSTECNQGLAVTPARRGCAFHEMESRCPP